MTERSNTTPKAGPRRDHHDQVRLTVWVPPNVRRDLKVEAAIAGQTLSEYVITALIARVARDIQPELVFPRMTQS